VKSLKLVLLITAIALVPLGLGVMVLKQSDQAQVEQDAALESEAGAAAARLRDSIAETRATVLITATTPSFGTSTAQVASGTPRSSTRAR